MGFNWKTVTQAQRQRLLRLERELPAVEVKTLRCPECGARMYLRLGRYGRFYGCGKWRKTKCKGGVSAYDDGTPRGTSPHDRAIFKARKSREDHPPKTSWQRILDGEFDLDVQEQVT